MVFSSIVFLFFFLPVTALLYLFASRFSGVRARNLVLVLASIVFYTWSSGALVLLLAVSTGVDYVIGARVAEAYKAGDDQRRRLLVASSVVVNLAMLGYFKYANFLVDAFNDLGFGVIAQTSIALPIGISFFTFQSMSYTIDVSRGRAEPLRNPVDFALYVALFPQLIAGPIVRYHEIAKEIGDRTSRFDDVAQGLIRFGHGLAKKVLVADVVAGVADAAFTDGGGDLSFAAAWIGIAAYTLQIYFDFSGYSDMAIGLGQIFGFTFPENFNRPYSAVSITDFWRRWHITLSNWFRDYVYIPLGGSKGGSTSTMRNLVAVFLLTGIWHGANWTFLLWGAYHGGWMLFERATNTRYLEGAPFAPLRRILTLALVMVGWVIFRSPTVGFTLAYLGAMFTPDVSGISHTVELALDRRSVLVLLAAGTVVLLPSTFSMGKQIASSSLRSVVYYRTGLLVLGLPLILVLVGSGTFSPFLYFQF